MLSPSTVPVKSRTAAALDLLRAVEADQVGGYGAVQVARNVFALVRADKASAMLLEDQVCDSGAPQIGDRACPLPVDRGRLALRKRLASKCGGLDSTA